ncbi:MAG: hypothetical protein Q4G68_09940 [Planctomycetia bacterium]|nr:hypothetical protein [Planctomycetia bacterium]
MGISLFLPLIALIVLAFLPTTVLAQYGDNRPIYAVGTTDLLWRPPQSELVISSKVYFPLGVLQRCPVVIFSHGLGSSSRQCEYLGRMWASRGLVAIFLEHPGSNEAVWRGKLRPLEDLKKAYGQFWSGRDRALMISMTIDHLYEMVAYPVPDGLSSLIDVRRIGVAGNDLGALAALLTAGQLPPDNGPALKDNRIAGVLALSPPVFTTEFMAPVVYAYVQVPVMSIAGTKDDGIVGTTKAWQRRIPYEAIRGVEHCHVTLNGGDHKVYTGMRFRIAGLTSSESDLPYQQAIMNASAVFWEAVLQGDVYARFLLRSGLPGLLANVGALEFREQ